MSNPSYSLSRQDETTLMEYILTHKGIITNQDRVNGTLLVYRRREEDEKPQVLAQMELLEAGRIFKEG